MLSAIHRKRCILTRRAWSNSRLANSIIRFRRIRWWSNLQMDIIPLSMMLSLITIHCRLPRISILEYFLSKDRADVDTHDMLLFDDVETYNTRRCNPRHNLFPPRNQIQHRTTSIAASYLSIYKPNLRIKTITNTN
jgi:hypothetical protein